MVRSPVHTFLFVNTDVRKFDGVLYMKVLTGALQTYAEKLKLLAEQNTGMRAELATVPPKIAALETAKATIEVSEKEARAEIAKLATEREALEKELADAKELVAEGSVNAARSSFSTADDADGRRRANVAASKAAADGAISWAIGDEVLGYYRGERTAKYPGVITMRNANGSYGIKFDDGDVATSVQSKDIFSKEGAGLIPAATSGDANAVGAIARRKSLAAAKVAQEEVVVAEVAAEKVSAEIDEHKEALAELEAFEADSPEEEEAKEDEIREKRATVADLETKLEEHIETAEIAAISAATATAAAAAAAIDIEDEDEEGGGDGKKDADLDSLASDDDLDKAEDADTDADADADADDDLASTADLTGSLEQKQAMEDEIERLKSEIDELKVANIGKVSDAETSELQVQIKMLQAEMEAQKVEIDKAKAEKKEEQEASMRRMSDSSGLEMAKLLTKIDALETEKSENQHAGIQKVAELEQLNEDKGKVEAQLKAAEEQRAAKEDAFKASRKKISSLEQKLLVAKNSAKSSGAAGGAGSKEQAEQIKKLQRNINKMEKENGKLQREVEASSTKTSAKPAISGAEKMKMDKAMAKFEKDAAKYKEGYEKTKGELKAAITEKGELEKSVKKAEFELSAAKKSMGASAELAVNLKAAEDQVTLLMKETKQSRKDIAEAGVALNEERKLRKKYYNQIEDMKGKIRVYCRARPISGSELERGNTNCIDSPDEYSIAITNAHGAGGKQHIEDFTFDRVYTAKNSQADVYEDTHALIQSAVDGYNVCIFAYGQTGSGKTYTMIGAPEEEKWGLAPRAFVDIFRVLDELGPTWESTVTINMVEIYCDKLKDLFVGPGGAEDHQLKIRKRKDGQVYVEGITNTTVVSAEDLNSTFTAASKNRVVKKTNMNAESSRSHLIISIFIESKDKIGGKVNSGKLSLIDLAGSERFGKTGATGQAAIEAQSINKSLSALAEVINALSTNKEHIPFRNSILTQLMQDSLGGNAKTLMFVNISPVDYNAPETINALKYAERAKKITNKAKVNVDSTQVAKLKAIIKAYEEGNYDAKNFGEETEELDVDEDFAGDATGEESAL